MNMRGESFREEQRTPAERPTSKHAQPRPTEAARPVTAHERKEARDADARRFVEAMVRASGSAEDTRAHVERRLREVRERIDAAERFEPKLQEEYEFLKAQERAIEAHPKLRVEPIRPTVPRISEAAPRPPAKAEPSLMERVRSGWNAFKERWFGTPELKKIAGTTQYEQTWTKERLARRETDRAQEMAEVQERAIERLEAKLDQVRARLKAVTDILSRRRKEPLPATARAKYVAEIQALQSDLKETERLLRIAQSSQERQRRARKEAA